MSRSLSSCRRLTLAGLIVLATLTLLVMALPAGAACPPPSRIVPVEPGRPEIYLLKSDLFSGLTNYEVVGVAAPVHGTLEEQSDRYVYRPLSGFWTAGIDSFLLHLSPLNRGARANRVETVLLVSALQPETLCQQSFESGSASWPTFGGRLEVFGPDRALSGLRSLRAYGFPGESSGLTCEGDSYGGGPQHGGGQQASGASATLRPPGRGAGSNLVEDPTLATPGEMMILKLGAGTPAEHRVWMYDDGTHLSFKLASLTGATAWIPVSRVTHRLQVLQWPRQDLSQRSGAALFVDGARVANLVPSAGNDVGQGAQALQAGALEIAGANPLYVELDDLVFQQISTSPAWSCLVADGFEDGVPDPAWTANGILGVNPDAAIEGQDGLEVPLSSGNATLRTYLPDEDYRLGVRFRFEPHSAYLPFGSRVLLASAVTSGGTFGEAHAFGLVLEGTPSNYRLTVLDDPYASNPKASSPIPLPNGPVEVELDWRRSASSNVGLGSLRLWINGESKATLAGLLNASLEIAELRLGAIVLPGGSEDSQGTLHFDQFLAVRGPRP